MSDELADLKARVEHLEWVVRVLRDMAHAHGWGGQDDFGEYTSDGSYGDEPTPQGASDPDPGL